jgi:signal transduction histidine kinase/ActR/RegA family two-component response regulator
MLRRYGSLGWTFSRAVPLTDANGVILEWFGAASDVTERKVAEEALRIANEQLKKVDKRKNEFLSVLSHELRNPLASIRNSIYIAGHAAPGSEQTRRALSVIDRQILQLTRLVDDLLDVTRIAHGKIRLHREEVDLQSLATQTAEDHHALFEKNGLQLEVMHTDEPLFVIGDPARLAQIIGNLLQNAAKVTPRGSRTTVSIRRSDEHLAEISVQDNGPGIAPEVLPTLFEPFVQGEKTLERSSGGLGLGLALVKGLVELHGGSVRAHSGGHGHGATFVVRIPVERRKTPRRTLVARPTAPSTPRRVLVIEDNIDAAETLKEALELNAHTVVLAYAGVEGVEKARAFKPDVVICDIGLTGMNGFEVAREIRADPNLRTSTLIALSGYALPEDVDRAVAAGFDLHLAKPPDLFALEQSIAEARVKVEDIVEKPSL